MLLLCVLAMRVVVPQGFMWSSDAHGSPQMVYCPGSGQMPAMSGMAAQHHNDRQDHDGKTMEHPCAFAAASAAVDLAGAAHPAIAQVTPRDAPTAAYRAARPGLGLAAPPPPKTGPPLLA